MPDVLYTVKVNVDVSGDTHIHINKNCYCNNVSLLPDIQCVDSSSGYYTTLACLVSTQDKVGGCK